MALTVDQLRGFDSNWGNLDDVIGGAEAQTLKDSTIKGSSLEQAANPVAELKKRMGTIANAKIFLQIVNGMTTSLFEKQGEKLVYNLDKADTPFSRDVSRDTSTADYSLSVTLPSGNLDTLSKCDWEHFGKVSDLTAKEASQASDRFETIQEDVPKDFRFTGDVSLSFSLRANQLITP